MPKNFTVSRSTRIQAPIGEVRARIADFHEWMAWSPWEGLDPAMQRTFTSSESGAGAHYAWEGNKEAGKGTMAITEANDHKVAIDLAFEKPFPSKNQIEFLLDESEAGTTTVT